MGTEQSGIENEPLIEAEKIFPEGYADNIRTFTEGKGVQMLDKMRNLPHYIEIVKKSGPDSDILISALLKDIENIKEFANELVEKADEIQVVLEEKDAGKIKAKPETEELKEMKKKAEEFAAKTVNLEKFKKEDAEMIPNRQKMKELGKLLKGIETAIDEKENK